MIEISVSTSDREFLRVYRIESYVSKSDRVVCVYIGLREFCECIGSRVLCVSRIESSVAVQDREFSECVGSRSFVSV